MRLRSRATNSTLGAYVPSALVRCINRDFVSPLSADGVDLRAVPDRIEYRVPRVQTRCLRSLQRGPPRRRGTKWPRSTEKRERSENRYQDSKRVHSGLSSMPWAPLRTHRRLGSSVDSLLAPGAIGSPTPSYDCAHQHPSAPATSLTVLPVGPQPVLELPLLAHRVDEVG